MRRNEFESRYNNWEERQLVAVITPKSNGRTAIGVQWAGLEEVREAAAVGNDCATWPPSEAFDAFDALDEMSPREAPNADSSDKLETGEEVSITSSFDKVENFVKDVVSKLNKSSGTLCFGFPNGDFMVAAESAGTIDSFMLIAKTIEAINGAWKSEMSGEMGWEMPSIYVDHSGKP